MKKKKFLLKTSGKKVVSSEELDLQETLLKKIAISTKQLLLLEEKIIAFKTFG